jgi:4-diphosphocytidyl-2-C-methyl-D-erythritol kinase
VIGEHAAAKVNLALHVTGRRADGYHLLETLVVFCELGDALSFEAAKADRLEIEGANGGGLDGGNGNLVARARGAFRQAVQEAGGKAPPVAIRLTKELPISSGIGGGSADAAATLRGLARLWRTEIDLHRTAAGLGADVPMCLESRAAIARGVGGALTPLDLPPLDLVLVNPRVAVSTPEVFARLSWRNNDPLPPPPASPSPEKLATYLKSCRNDLEAAAMGLAPEITAVLAAIDETRPLFARMSGSGATCFGLYSNREEAERAAMALQAAFPHWYIRATRTGGEKQ